MVGLNECLDNNKLLIESSQAILKDKMDMIEALKLSVSARDSLIREDSVQIKLQDKEIKRLNHKTTWQKVWGWGKFVLGGITGYLVCKY